jgi:hypothetical protein
MPIFAVSRRGEREPIFAIDAVDAADAVATAEEQERIGALEERGYAPSPGGYVAAPATEEQRQLWTASIRHAAAVGDFNVNEDHAEWLSFLRPPDFDPAEENDRD